LSEPGAALPLLERFPQHVGEEADEDVGLHAIGPLLHTGRMPISLFWIRNAALASVNCTCATAA
jgi:hypothetical protein